MSQDDDKADIPALLWFLLGLTVVCGLFIWGIIEISYT